jgi:streptogramin lyase
MRASTRDRGVLRHERSQLLRLFMMVVALVTGLAIALGTLLSAAQAAPEGKLEQFKVPTAGSSPEHITQASDGNFWFTESFVNDQNALPHKVGRITQSGQVTEFNVCEHPDFGFESCFPTDIVQGSDGDLYFTKNDAPLGRITTDGDVLPDVGERFSFNGNGLDAHGDDIWIADFNNAVIHRYNVQTGVFSEFATTSPTFDVAVAQNGIVWFTEGDGRIGQLNPGTGVVTEIAVDGFPRQINIASDGAVWFTERFTPQAVGRINPVPNPTPEDVTLFPVDGGPEDIAPAAGGSMWFTRTTGDNIALISPTGEITATSKVVKGSEPFGITVAPNGNPWFTMLSADKIATLQLTK